MDAMSKIIHTLKNAFLSLFSFTKKEKSKAEGSFEEYTIRPELFLGKKGRKHTPEETRVPSGKLKATELSEGDWKMLISILEENNSKNVYEKLSAVAEKKFPGKHRGDPVVADWINQMRELLPFVEAGREIFNNFDTKDLKELAVMRVPVGDGRRQEAYRLYDFFMKDHPKFEEKFNDKANENKWYKKRESTFFGEYSDPMAFKLFSCIKALAKSKYQLELEESKSRLRKQKR